MQVSHLDFKITFFNTVVSVCEHAGLNKDFKKMLSMQAEFMVLKMKDILTATDGTRKVEVSFFGGHFCCLFLCLAIYLRIFSLTLYSQEVTDSFHIGRWTGH